MVFLILVVLGLWSLFSESKTLKEELLGETRYSHIKREK